MTTPSEETPAPELPELPAKESRTKTLSFTVPHILKSISLDEGGNFHRDVREGGIRQVEHEIETEWYREEVKEDVFRFRATNQLNFMGAIIDVINDEIELSNGFRLVATEPTASDYLSKVGTRVIISFMCRKDVKRNIFRIDRVFIKLP